MTLREVPFAEVVRDVSAGNAKLLRSEFEKAGQIPVVDQGQDFVAGYTNDSAYQFCSEELPVVIFGDHTRALKYIDFPFAMGADGVKVLKPNTNCDVKYLYHYLRHAHIPSAGYSRHFRFLKDLRIPLPSLSEQQRIADILDKADALRAQRRAALAELDTLTQSIFLTLFGDLVTNSKGWPETKTLGDVADIASGITKGRLLKGQATREVAYLAVSNVQDKALNMGVVKTIDATEAEITRFRLQNDDLLLTEGGDPDKLGRGTLWNGELDECIHQNHVFRVRGTDKAVDPLFLNWLVGSHRGKQYFLRSAKQTTGIASINMTQLRAFPLLLPPLKLQQDFARRITAIETLKSRHRTALAELDTLFASLQHRAFRGEL